MVYATVYPTVNSTFVILTGPVHSTKENLVVRAVERTGPVRMTNVAYTVAYTVTSTKNTYSTDCLLLGGHSPQIKALKNFHSGFSAVINASLCARSIFFSSFSRAMASCTYWYHS